MRIALCSDARYLTSTSFGGHGLGRSVARTAKYLALRGHTVFVYALPASEVEGCTIVPSTDEGIILAEQVMAVRSQYDIVIDSTHLFCPAQKLKEVGFPFLCKICDMEGASPGNSVYGVKNQATQHNDPNGIIVHEGVELNEIPFNSAARQPHLIWAALKREWKRPDLAVEIARRLNSPIHMIGEGDLFFTDPMVRNLPAMSPMELYRSFGQATALVACVPSHGLVEAAATGTPGLSLGSDEVADGVTGFVRDTVDELVYAAKEGLPYIKPAACREWVASERNIVNMTEKWEALCERVLNGETW